MSISRYNLLILIVLILTVAVASALAGCGRSVENAIVSTTFDSESVAGAGSSAGHMLWGFYTISADPSSTDLPTIQPLRLSSFHFNARIFLEEYPCNSCLRITTFDKTADGFDIGLTVIHPFAGHSELTCFDVRGILFTDASFVFPNLGTRVPSPMMGDTYVANADGYTTLFNPTEYAGSGLFKYSRGRLIPQDMPAPSAMLGAFKAFYAPDQSEDVGGKRAFRPGEAIEKTYEVIRAAATPLVMGYAIDCCWEAPMGDPPFQVENFPIEANCPEPFRFDITQSENSLTTDCGSVKVEITVYDHQGIYDLGPCTLEAPGLTDSILVDDSPQIVSLNIARYEFILDNENGIADSLGEEVLLRVDQGTSDPHFGMVPAWYFFTVPVATPASNPTISSIDPDTGLQGTTVQVAIQGSGFMPNPSVQIYQGINALVGYGIVVESSCRITAQFDLDGPPGQYTLYVENQNNIWTELQNAFTIL